MPWAGLMCFPYAALRARKEGKTQDGMKTKPSLQDNGLWASWMKGGAVLCPQGCSKMPSLYGAREREESPL